MLKIKKIVNYRQAKISVDGRNRNCGHCANTKTIDIHNCGTGEKIGTGLRCSVIGSGESRGHSIAVNHICDRINITDKCWYRGCKSPAEGYHCKSCNARVCREHQEPSGYGNHGNLVGDIKIGENPDWKRI